MKLNVLRMITDQLNHGTEGVNALLSTIPIDVGESAPVALDAIVDSTRDNDAARLLVDPNERTLPIGIVFDPDAMPIEGWTLNTNVQRADSVLIGIAFVVSTTQTADGLRDGMIYRRAARRSLNLLNQNDAAHMAAKERNDIRITRAVEFVDGPSWAELETGATLAAPLSVRTSAQDEKP